MTCKNCEWFAIGENAEERKYHALDVVYEEDENDAYLIDYDDEYYDEVEYENKLNALFNKYENDGYSIDDGCPINDEEQ